MSVTALIIDDSPAARQIVAYYLRHAGCTVVGEATDAFQALQLFRRLRPDVVTLDLMMPKVFNVGSSTLLTVMKREVPKVVVIVVSAIPFEKTREEILARGAAEYVVKPLDDLSFAPVRKKLQRAFPELAPAPAVESVSNVPPVPAAR